MKAKKRKGKNPSTNKRRKGLPKRFKSAKAKRPLSLDGSR